MGDIVSESTGDFISVRLGDFVGIRNHRENRQHRFGPNELFDNIHCEFGAMVGYTIPGVGAWLSSRRTAKHLAHKALNKWLGSAEQAPKIRLGRSPREHGIAVTLHQSYN